MFFLKIIFNFWIHLIVILILSILSICVNTASSPLHDAAEAGDIKIVKYHVEKKNADINANDTKGRTALYLALSKGRLEVVKYLLDNGASTSLKDGNTLLIIAMYSGNLDVVKYLVEERDLDVNEKNKQGQTPLFIAALTGRMEIVKYLVEEKKADINVKDNNGDSPLKYAAMTAKVDIMKYLTKHGADLNEKNNNGQTVADFIKNQKSRLKITPNKSNVEKK
jgi:ankyrin repeat protein